MPNVIEIIVQGTGNFQGTFLQAEEAMTGLEAAGQKLFAMLGGPLGVGLAAAGAGAAVLEMASKFGESVIGLENLSAKTGIAINDLRVLQTVLREAHLPTETLGMALAMLNRNLAEHKKALVAIVGETTDPMQALLKLSEAVAAGGNAADVAFKAMGRGGMSLAPILRTLGERVGDVKTRLDELDPATVQAAKSWDEMVEKMKTKWQNFQMEVGKGIVQIVSAFTQPTWMRVMAMARPGSDAAERAGISDRTPPPPPRAGPVYSKPILALAAAWHMTPKELADMLGADWNGDIQDLLSKGLIHGFYEGLTMGPMTEATAQKQAEAEAKKLLEVQNRMQEAALETYRRSHAVLIEVSKDAAQSIQGSFDQIWADVFNGSHRMAADLKNVFADLAKTIVQDLTKIAIKMAEIGILNTVGAAFGAPELGTITLGGGAIGGGAKKSSMTVELGPKTLRALQGGAIGAGY